MKNIIGYYTLIGAGHMDDWEDTEEEFCKSCKIDGYFSGTTVSENRFKPDDKQLNDSYDFVNKIGMTMVEYDNDTGMCKILYKQPIPENIALITMASFDKPIYESYAQDDSNGQIEEKGN